ncbi:CocE/NonD family hydrolase [Phyllobacterium sp. YR531]|uniref:alpha/beta hydrolase family protein n=1 Tax=Phyllobacterium sp. YR531 TaxID=1144343 RepID=UPI000691E6FC|nr:CocE/NonD family hydrolase [Phyllobacterium sp. YR531]
MTGLLAVIVLFILQSPASGQSKVDEAVYGGANQQIEGMVREPLSLEIVLPNAKRYKLDAFVTRPDRAGRFPVALITHGSEGNEDDKLTEPNKFSGAAIAFARHGYASVVVLRRGYGRSDGKLDYENSTCEKPRHLRSGEIARGDLLAALEAIRKKDWAAPDKTVLLGTSTGGFSVLAASALNPAGVQAVINFSGGRGAKDGGGICSRKAFWQQ